MQSMLLAEFAVFIKLYPIRIVLFVLIGLIVAILAFCAGQRNRIAHLMHSLLLENITYLQNVTNIIYHT